MNRAAISARHPAGFGDAPRIEICEPRLALSASPAADALLDAFAPDVFGSDANALDGDAAAGDLWQQALELRNLYGLAGQGQTIAVIDSGIAYDHVALGGGYGPGYRVVGGWDFAEDDADPYDDAPSGFHGSHVAGILAGRSEQFVGLAPEADLVALRVFDDNGASQLAWVESALQWVYDQRDAFANSLTTVNLSLGALLPDQLAEDVQGQLEDELRQLREAGIAVFAAAGNRFDPAAPDRLNYPAASDHAIPVASAAEDGRGLSDFSQRREGIFAAPGERIISTVPDHVLGWDGTVDDLAPASGTSMSTPQAAAAGVLVRQAFQQLGGTPDVDAIAQHLQQTADRLSDPETGVDFYRLNLFRAVDSLLATAPEPPPPEPSPAETSPAEPPLSSTEEAIPLGRFELGETSVQLDRWHSLAASREGLLSIRPVLDPEGDSGLHLRIVRSDGAIAWDGPVPATEQIDLQVAEGEQLRMLARGSDSSPRLVIGNLATLRDDHFAVVGTRLGDSATVDLSDGVRVEIGGLFYAFADGRLGSVDVDLGSGSDSLQVAGSSRAEQFTLRSSDGTITRPGLDVALRQIERIAAEGGGGADRAYLYDSAGDDSLVLRPHQADLSGVGFERSASGMQRIYVHATAGGNDSAFLYDSAGDDRLAVRPQFTSIRSDAYFNSAVGFERVNAYATGGGFDVADLHDSAGDDRMTASAKAAWISGSGYFAHARHFDAVTAHATAGGSDWATLYAGSDEERWLRTSDQVRLEGAEGGSNRTARGFERTETYIAGKAFELAPLSLDPLASAGNAGGETSPTDGSPTALDLRAAQLLWAIEPQAAESAWDRCWPSAPGDPQTERDALRHIFAEFDAESED